MHIMKMFYNGLLPFLLLWSADAFTLQPARQTQNIYASRTKSVALFATTDDVSSMRASEIKRELESYGISTKSFLEKSELVDALTKARAEGKTPKKQTTTTTSSSSASSSSTSSSASSSSSSSTSSKSREERLQEEMVKLSTKKASELKKELLERGISTKSFFEKSEFVKALAEARVDGVQKRGGGSTDEEGYAEYKNVEVLTDDSSGPRRKQSQQQQQQQQQGGNPFGGGGNPFGGGGGMGGMGNIADMLKNMGMGGGGANPFAGGAGAAGANPFGGGGGANPFGAGMGDAMGKAQELMQNPKVRELMAKAQSNPKLMKAMTECMSNPAAFAKYQNDPEVSELINELRKYM